MPRRHFRGHHEQLVHDEGRVGDRHHPRRDAGEEMGEDLDRGALVHRDGAPREEGAIAETALFFHLRVELGIHVRQSWGDVRVEDKRKDRKHGVDGRIPHQEPVLVERFRFVVTRDAEDGLTYGDDETAVHDELGQFGRAFVAVAPVPHQQFGEVGELRHREVGGERRLATFLAHDAETHVGGLDHGHVVATVADGAGPLARMLANQPGHLCFLRWRATTRDDTRKQHRGRDELLTVVRQHQRERFAVDEEARRGRVTQERECIGSVGCIGHYIWRG